MIAPAYTVATQALREAAMLALREGRQEDRELYLSLLDQLQAGDVELVPKRREVAYR